MPRCAICLQDRRTLKFKTGRLSICNFCVNSLNKTHLSACSAEQKWFENFKIGILRREPDAYSWVDRWIEKCGNQILSQKLADPAAIQKSHELKILRANNGGIVCWNRSYLDYPKNWSFKRFRTKHWDDYSCNKCGATENEGAILHTHHIIFRSRSGTNSYRNLVTLCLKHHQAEHDHDINTNGGEPSGHDIDTSIEEIDSNLTLNEAKSTSLPQEFDELVYIEVRPIFEAALEAFIANGKSARELFVFLIQTFGNNVGIYALQFARDEQIKKRWFRKKNP